MPAFASSTCAPTNASPSRSNRVTSAFYGLVKSFHEPGALPARFNPSHYVRDAGRVRRVRCRQSLRLGVTP